MMTENGLFYTLEELRELTGLATSTIYNLTQEGVTTSPVRGLLPGNPGKGLYRPEALDRIRTYIHLRSKGHSSKAAKAKIVGAKEAA